jgi:hypothetical protein
LNQPIGLANGGIFISYAAEDRERAKALAHALEQRGWPVWWDRKIRLGESFDEAIEQALSDSRCVLVLWTKASTASRWVRSEASEAAARGVLIPVLLEPDVRIPLEFKLLQAANLGDWHDDPAHPEFQGLIAHIEAMLGAAGGSGADQTRADGQPGTDTAAGPAGAGSKPVRLAKQEERAVTRDASASERMRPGAQRSRPDRRLALALILVPGMIFTLGPVVLTGWRTPTRVTLDAIVDRASFTLAGGEPVAVPERPVAFRSLSMENFDRVVFATAQLATGPRNQPRRVRMGDTTGRQVVLRGAEGYRSMFMIASLDPSAPVAGRVEAIAAQPQSRVTVESSSESASTLTLRVDGQDLATNVLPVGAVEITVNNASVDGIDGFASNDRGARLEVALPAHSPYLQIEGTRPSFTLGVTLRQSDTVSLVGRARIQDIELLKQGTRGEVESALVAASEIRYADYPRVPAIQLRAGDFVGLDELEGGSLNRLESRADGPGIALQLEAVAGRLETSSAGTKRDRRLTMLETLWHGSRAIMLLVVATCMLSIAIGVYRLYTLMSAHR